MIKLDSPLGGLFLDFVSFIFAGGRLLRELAKGRTRQILKSARGLFGSLLVYALPAAFIDLSEINDTREKNGNN